jgi:hypothetical protein
LKGRCKAKRQEGENLFASSRPSCLTRARLIVSHSLPTGSGSCQRVSVSGIVMGAGIVIRSDSADTGGRPALLCQCPSIELLTSGCHSPVPDLDHWRGPRTRRVKPQLSRDCNNASGCEIASVPNNLDSGLCVPSPAQIVEPWGHSSQPGQLERGLTRASSAALPRLTLN